MGNQRTYLPNGGFSPYLYEPIGSKVTVGGVDGKMVKKITDPKGTHDGLPSYAGTSDIYFKMGDDGLASQARLYQDRKSLLDFDWDHNHTNEDGTQFNKGTVHVQIYKVDEKGNVIRQSKTARPMTEYEKKKYGPIIKHFNPKVKL